MEKKNKKRLKALKMIKEMSYFPFLAIASTFLEVINSVIHQTKVKKIGSD
ncbi:hypothetical protein [Photorhabdus temperata]|nr:hypothetical protein [Photorhabdus temperata]